VLWASTSHSRARIMSNYIVISPDKPSEKLQVSRPPYPPELQDPESFSSDPLEAAREASRLRDKRSVHLRGYFKDKAHVTACADALRRDYGEDLRVWVNDLKYDRYEIEVVIKRMNHYDTHVTGHYHLGCQASYEQFALGFIADQKQFKQYQFGSFKEAMMAHEFMEDGEAVQSLADFVGLDPKGDWETLQEMLTKLCEAGVLTYSDHCYEIKK